MPSITLLTDTRGRPPRFDGPLTPQRRGVEAYKAYHRAVLMACNPKLQESNPRLCAEIDRWLYEIHHGKPRIQIDQRVSGAVMVYSPDDLLRAGVLTALAEATDTGVLELPAGGQVQAAAIDVQAADLDPAGAAVGSTDSDLETTETEPTASGEELQTQNEATAQQPPIKEADQNEQSPSLPMQSSATLPTQQARIRQIMNQSLAGAPGDQGGDLPATV